ncbi:MAG: hypothetical protein H7Y03_05550 [Chitinophagaceae bacterium]|nr:hypothetical protein [Chitinophagaceae bacterium]
MKRISTLIVFMSMACAGFAQAGDPVSWTFTSRKVADKTYEIHLTASLSSPWHTYSQTTPDGGPLPTKIEFTRNPLVTADGKTKEIGKLQTKHEPVFGVDVKQYEGKVDFVQVVKLKTNVKTNVSGNVEYMACDDNQCLPPKSVPFTVAIGGK